jgi:hypothetical protein
LSLGTIKKNMGGMGMVGFGLAQISMGHPCQIFDTIGKIFYLFVTISDLVRRIRIVDIWVVPSGWGYFF